MTETHVLVVTHEDDYMPPDVFGPYPTVEDAQAAAETYRRNVELPIEATAENNEEWTNLGWYFGIVALKKVEAQA